MAAFGVVPPPRAPPPAHIPREGGTQSVLSDGRVLLCGGVYQKRYAIALVCPT